MLCEAAGFTANGKRKQPVGLFELKQPFTG